MYTDRAIAYREEMGYEHYNVDMAVAVQKMVRPRAAGVAFTLDPTNGDRSGVCIDSAWGFGEGVVSGSVTPDNFLVDKVMWCVNRRTISPKAQAYQLVDDGVQLVDLDEDTANAPSLVDEEIVAIAQLARTAEKHYGCPQDIEWAVDDDLPAGRGHRPAAGQAGDGLEQEVARGEGRDRPDVQHRVDAGQSVVRTKRGSGVLTRGHHVEDVAQQHTNHPVPGSPLGTTTGG